MAQTTPQPMPDASNEKLKPGEAIALWRAKQLASAPLLRVLAEHDAWQIALADTSPAASDTPIFDLFLDSAGRKQLFLFETQLAYDEFLEKTGRGVGHVISVPGFALFQTDLSSIDALTINPLGTNTLTLTRDQYERMSYLGGAVFIEQVLLRLRQGAAQADDVGHVKRFGRYWLALQDPTEQAPDVVRGIALAPDDQGRRLAAIFTAQDGFDAFAEWWATTRQPGELKVSVLPGVTLFVALAQQNLDGLVFNCEGPPDPIAFGLAMAQIVMNEP